MVLYDRQIINILNQSSVSHYRNFNSSHFHPNALHWFDYTAFVQCCWSSNLTYPIISSSSPGNQSSSSSKSVYLLFRLLFCKFF